MAAPGTLEREIAEIPVLVAARLGAAADCVRAAAAIRAAAPRFALTIGRGSSDAVCEALGRFATLRLGLVAASLPPSLVTVAGARPRVAGTVAFTVSQSGVSPDLVETTRAVRLGGALTIGVINAHDSPLGDVCDHVLASGAGPETSIAATKSVILSWLVGLMLIEAVANPGCDFSTWRPVADAIEQTNAIDWSAAAEQLDQPALFVVARGAAYAAAREAALKLKELAGTPAEALSGAEIMHGPKAALTNRVAILALMASDAHAPGMLQTVSQLSGLTDCIVTVGIDHDVAVPRSGVTGPAGPQLDALVLCAALYRLFIALAHRRGRSPDNPAHLTKITLTR